MPELVELTRTNYLNKNLILDVYGSGAGYPDIGRHLIHGYVVGDFTFNDRHCYEYVRLPNIVLDIPPDRRWFVNGCSAGSLTVTVDGAPFAVDTPLSELRPVHVNTSRAYLAPTDPEVFTKYFCLTFSVNTIYSSYGRVKIPDMIGKSFVNCTFTSPCTGCIALVYGQFADAKLPRALEVVEGEQISVVGDACIAYISSAHEELIL